MNLLLALFLASSHIQTHTHTIPIQVEHAVTPQQREKGLSGRTSLGLNEGMLFHFEKPIQVNIWMYQTLIDLSVAFLDEQGVIREIHELKAYPEMHERSFFLSRTVSSKFKASYALEMNAHWFRDHAVGVGDRLILNF